MRHRALISEAPAQPRLRLVPLDDRRPRVTARRVVLFALPVAVAGMLWGAYALGKRDQRTEPCQCPVCQTGASSGSGGTG